MDLSWLDLTHQGVGILLQLAILAGMFLLRKFKQSAQTFYESNTTIQQRQLLSQLGREAFVYAETVYAQMDGPAKLNEAIKYLYDRCDTCGIENLHMQEARAVVESAWLEDRRLTGRPVEKAIVPAQQSPAEQR